MRLRLYILIMMVTPILALAQQDVTVNIRYEDKQIYAPSSEILIKFTIRNNGASTYRFKLAENRMFNVDFDVRTLNNVPLEPADEFTLARTSNQQLYYREVSLETGEEFSFTESLDHYIEIPHAGVYVVRARFYPDLVGSPVGAIPAVGPLSLSVRPEMDDAAEIQAIIDTQTRDILQRQALPPDEVVTYTLAALQEGNWNRYFLYLDIEGLYLSEPSRERAYGRFSEQERVAALATYRERLQDQLSDPELSARPTQFQMVRTEYSPTAGSVIVDQRFRFPTFTEVKRYTYFVRRTDRIWWIYDYSVQNLGTE